ARSTGRRINNMDKGKAHEVAVKMFQLEGDRWAKNALGLLGAVFSIFFAYGRAFRNELSLFWPFALSAGVSFAAALIALSIRATTDAWRSTICCIEHTPPGATDLRPFDT